jgi:hypothetical protein
LGAGSEVIEVEGLRVGWVYLAPSGEFQSSGKPVVVGEHGVGSGCEVNHDIAVGVRPQRGDGLEPRPGAERRLQTGRAARWVCGVCVGFQDMRGMRGFPGYQWLVVCAFSLLPLGSVGGLV